MMGGHWFHSLFGKNPNLKAIETLAVTELKRIMGIDEDPTHVVGKIQENCIAQYTVGHKQRVEKARRSLQDLPISLVGTSYDGVGLNDGILSARQSVTNLNSDTF